MEKYIFLLLFLHNIVFRRIGSLVYPVCKVSAFKEYHLGTDCTDDSFCMAYYPGKRIHGRNSHGDNRIGLFTALTYWNDWYMCMLFIDKNDLMNLQYLLYQLMGSIKALREIASQTTVSVSSMPIESTKMALTVVATGPIILLYPFVQKYFVKGITLGAVKG